MSRPVPPRPVPPLSPSRTEAEPGMPEGFSREERVEIVEILGEEGTASEEGVSLEGDFLEAEPVLVPEVLHEREELIREREEFYREAAELTRVEDKEGIKP
ncbi:MAG: hypothetical protein GX493_11090, partial [Firmicutes bacterium]|nr:hypothetical protein [Bacillota bacterium]